MSDPYNPGIPPVPPQDPYTPPSARILPPADVDSSLTPPVKTSGMLCHLLALCGYVIPFGNIIGPLIVWLTQKDKSPFIDHHGKESLNFQITVTIAAFVCIILCFVLIGIPLLFALGIYALIMSIIGAIKANEGRLYSYPYTFRFIK